jgi:hypothetical protein
MTSVDFLNRLITEMPGRHRLLRPLENSELEEWCAKWPREFLPDDLVEFLRLANGVQLWVDEGSPEGYFRILSLREIDSARRIMWSSAGDELPEDEVPYPHWLAITEHVDGADYFVLDTDRHRYFRMDTCGADLTPAGNDVDELLDYLWEQWVRGMG